MQSNSISEVASIREAFSRVLKAAGKRFPAAADPSNDEKALRVCLAAFSRGAAFKCKFQFAFEQYFGENAADSSSAVATFLFYFFVGGLSFRVQIGHLWRLEQSLEALHMLLDEVTHFFESTSPSSLSCTSSGELQKNILRYSVMRSWVEMLTDDATIDKCFADNNLRERTVKTYEVAVSAGNVLGKRLRFLRNGHYLLRSTQPSILRIPRWCTIAGEDDAGGFPISVHAPYVSPILLDAYIFVFESSGAFVESVLFRIKVESMCAS